MSAPSPRVMHVVVSLWPGGAERLVIDLCRKLHPGVPSSVCCLDEPGSWAHLARSAGVSVTALGRRPGLNPSLGYRIARLARQDAATVVHCHQYSPFVYSCIAGILKPDLRLVYTEHGRLSDAPPSAKRTRVNRVLGRCPDRIVAVSSELRSHMCAEGFRASRVDVIRNGIDPGRETDATAGRLARHSLGLPGGTLVVGTVARLDRVKRLDVTIEAFTSVVRAIPDATLVIVGGGPEDSRLRRLVANCGLGVRVKFLGVRDDVRAVLPAFDVYVNSSASEGISLTLLEAMAARRPVVATSVGGTPEVISDGVSGLLVPSGDSRALAEAVAGLWLDPRRRSMLGAAARSRVVDHFSLDRMVDEYLVAYGGRGRRRDAEVRGEQGPGRAISL